MNAIILLSLLVGAGLGYLIGLIRIRQVEKIAVTDTLTGVYNRAWLDKTTGRLISSAERSKTNLSVLMIDLNNFKEANDRFGHQFGDKVLKSVSSAMVNSVRKSDFIFRYGGDEFVIVLINTSSDGALRLARKIKDKFNKIDLKTRKGKSFQVGASIGIASYPEHGKTDQELLKAADEAVYEAKDSSDHIEVKK